MWEIAKVYLFTVDSHFFFRETESRISKIRCNWLISLPFSSMVRYFHDTFEVKWSAFHVFYPHFGLQFFMTCWKEQKPLFKTFVGKSFLLNSYITSMLPSCFYACCQFWMFTFLFFTIPLLRMDKRIDQHFKCSWLIEGGKQESKKACHL